MDNYNALKDLYDKLVGEDRPMSVYEQQQKAGRRLAEVYGIRRGFIGKVLMNTRRVGPFSRGELENKLVEENVAEDLEHAAGYVHAIINDNGRKVGHTRIIKFAAGDSLRYYIEEGDH